MKRLFLLWMLFLTGSIAHAAMGDISPNRIFEENGVPVEDFMISLDLESCDECAFSPGSISVTSISDCRKGFTAAGSSITFPCSITGYTWDFGDTETGVGSSVLHEYSSSGTYVVCVTITYEDGFGVECSAEICRTIEVEGCIDPCEECEFRPGSIVVADISDCLKGFTTTGSSITFPCSITGYTWDFGDTETGIGGAVTHEYESGGTYVVCVTITYENVFGEECSEEICSTIEVEGCVDPCDECEFSPGSIVVADISDCLKGFTTTGSSITFPCSITGYTWDFGDTETGIGGAVTHEYESGGTYVVCVTITYENVFGEECSEEICSTIEVEGCVDPCDECEFSPGSIVVADISDCLKGFTTTGSSITFPCSITGYTWDFGDTGTGTGGAVTHEYESNGTYVVCVTITYENVFGEECSEEICSTIEVEGCVDPCDECEFSPGSIVVADISDCLKGFTTSGSSITFPCSITGYTWDFGDAGTGTGGAVTHEYASGGTYVVCVTITYENVFGEECSEELCRTIEVEGCVDPCEECRFSPGSMVVIDISGCRKGFTTTGSSITFPCSIRGYTWDFGDTGTGTGSAVIHTYAADGTYEVCVTITYENGFGEECTEELCRTIEVEGCADIIDSPDRGPTNVGGGDLNRELSSIEAVARPNPASGDVTITVFNPSENSNEDQYNIVIRTMAGSEVYRSTIVNGAAKTIEVSHLEAGIYLYEIFNSEGVHIVEKLMVK